MIINSEGMGCFGTDMRLTKVHRVLFKFEAFKGVAVFLNSLLLSLFFKIDCTVSAAKSGAVKTQNWCSASECLMTLSFTANDILLFFSLVFSYNYGQQNTKKNQTHNT